MGTIKVEEIWHQVSCKSRPRFDQIVSKNLKKSWVPLKCKTTKRLSLINFYDFFLLLCIFIRLNHNDCRLIWKKKKQYQLE